MTPLSAARTGVAPRRGDLQRGRDGHLCRRRRRGGAVGPGCVVGPTHAVAAASARRRRGDACGGGTAAIPRGEAGHAPAAAPARVQVPVAPAAASRPCGVSCCSKGCMRVRPGGEHPEGKSNQVHFLDPQHKSINQSKSNQVRYAQPSTRQETSDTGLS